MPKICILNIPLLNGGGDDPLAWAHGVNGIYSVKSAYHALVNQKEHDALHEGTVTGRSQTDEQMWKSLWKLKVMSNGRGFWWRVVRHIL